MQLTIFIEYVKLNKIQSFASSFLVFLCDFEVFSETAWYTRTKAIFLDCIIYYYYIYIYIYIYNIFMDLLPYFLFLIYSCNIAEDASGQREIWK